MPNHLFSRRTLLKRIAGSFAIGTFPSLAAADSPAEPAATTLGLVVYDCSIRRRWLQQQNAGFDLFEPLNFLKHCHSLGAGGMQARLGMLDSRDAGRLRQFAERHDMVIDAVVNPPKDRSDVDRFEAEIRTAADVHVQAVRTVVMPGRRYEQFSSLAAFREAVANAERMMERAAPIVEKHRVPLAIENHKDQRIDERVTLFRRLQCEFIGACVDTGNSFALLDDPYHAVESLAPFAFTVHLKDQAVREYRHGFLLGDIPLGDGCFDLKRIVRTLKRAKPHIRFALELITRDALKVPCLTDKYWTTLPNVAGRDLARALRLVREHPAQHLPQVSTLSPTEQLALEDANLAASLKYAREQLGL